MKTTKIKTAKMKTAKIKTAKMKTAKMKKKNFILTISILMILALSFSCTENDKREEDCFSSESAYVTSINSPTTGTVNEIINIEVTFAAGSSSCYRSAEFIETSIENSRSIEIEAKYEGCICTLDFVHETITYQFTASNVGDYELNFKSSPTEFITTNLTIN